MEKTRGDSSLSMNPVKFVEDGESEIVCFCPVTSILRGVAYSGGFQLSFRDGASLSVECDNGEATLDYIFAGKSDVTLKTGTGTIKTVKYNRAQLRE